MWTCSTISIKKNGKIVHTQYSQWDGYPTGQGAGIRAFFEDHSKWNDISVFAHNVSGIYKLCQEEIDTVNADDNWTKTYPWLSRDCGSNILKYILENPKLGLLPDWAMLRPIIWIGWSYLIDLDTNEWYVFHGSTLTGKEDDEVTEKDREIGIAIKAEAGVAKPLYVFSLINPPTAEEWADKFSDY